eukprot:1958233-Pyramimonas_sp.AAC.1
MTAPADLLPGQPGRLRLSCGPDGDEPRVAQSCRGELLNGNLRSYFGGAHPPTSDFASAVASVGPSAQQSL